LQYKRLINKKGNKESLVFQISNEISLSGFLKFFKPQMNADKRRFVAPDSFFEGYNFIYVMREL